MEREEKGLQKAKVCYALPTLSLFALIYLVVTVCLSARAKREHLYQDKHTSQCQISFFRFENLYIFFH